jgi:ubiquinone/menaquinone biosynthesis C-methylase UbiE
MGNTTETFRMSVGAAEVYESKFVPALFGEWAPHLVEAAGVAPGQAVLDVACGTGVVARAAAGRTGGHGRVVGVDLNEAMLVVAQRLRPDIEWRQGDAQALPFPDASLDVVVCQSGLMFLSDVVGALREMARVVRPGGTVAVQVWDRLEAQTGYAPLHEVVARHAGQEAVGLMSAYFALGDLDQLSAWIEAAGLRVAATRTRVGAVRLGSLDEFVTVEVEGTPLLERISDEAYGRIRADAVRALAGFAGEDGRAAIPIAGHLVTARRQGPPAAPARR